MRNGRALKSGYEEGCFRQRENAGVDDEIAQKAFEAKAGSARTQAE